jgi:multidrug efflux pump subunit AcrA (membrane-fusion protein)
MKLPKRSGPAALTRVALPALLAALAIGCSGGAAPEEEADSGPMEPCPVQAATAELTTLRPSLDLVGTTVAVPERTASVSPQLGGWVEQVFVVEGQPVQAGHKLAQLDARAAASDVARAHASVAEKQAVLARLKRGYLPQELEVARRERDKAREAMEALQTEVTALQGLLARREVSDVHYDSKLKALNGAKAAFGAADAHAQLLEAGTPPEMIDEAQALLDVAQADLEHAQLAVQWCTISSPIDGMVVQLLARQGQFFDRAAPLATIIDLSEVFVQLRIPSSEFSRVAAGTLVDVELTALPGRSFQGTVTRISGEADPLTGNVNVFAAVKNEGGELRPGLSCRARVWLPELPDALVVPVNAVADNAGTPVVTVIRDGKAFEVEVELGAETDEVVQVLKGLSAGDVVATAGGYGLPEGCPVQVVADLSDRTAAQ